MKLLLTGSSGFIGSYFQNNYSDRYDIKTFSFLKDDLESLDLTHIDVVVHLSALVHQMGGAVKEEYRRVNVDQTLALANKAKQSGVKQFVFMSSVKVYGEETDTPYTEVTPCNPMDDYGVSKLEAEKLLKEMEEDAPKGISAGHFTVSVLRTPIVYGKGVKANILNLVKLVDKVPMLPFGGIGNRRSMVYIGNLCDMIDRICESGRSGTFLAGDDEPVSTTGLIEIIAKVRERKVILLSIPLFPQLLKTVKPDFYKRLYESLEVDNRWSKEVLGFENRVSTEEGIKLMLDGMQ